MPTDKDLDDAHSRTFRSRKLLSRSELAGCFHCLSIYIPDTIREWIDRNDETALCPKCGIDSVLGSAAGYPITKAFLTAMQERWFRRLVPLGSVKIPK